MGHKAMTVCMVIANRLIKEANTGYKHTIDTPVSYTHLLNQRISTQSKIIERFESFIKGLRESLFSQRRRFMTNSGNNFPNWDHDEPLRVEPLHHVGEPPADVVIPLGGVINQIVVKYLSLIHI